MCIRDRMGNPEGGLPMGSSDFPQWKKYLLELGGTFALSFFGPAAIVVGFLVPWLDGPSRLFLAALVPGLTLGTCLGTFAKYSGSHVNPAITVTFASYGSLKKRFVLPYVTFQLMGALLAGLTPRTVFDTMVPSAYLGSNRLGAGVSPIEGIALEVVGTTALCLVVLWVVASVRGTGRGGDHRRRHLDDAHILLRADLWGVVEPFQKPRPGPLLRSPG